MHMGHREGSVHDTSHHLSEFIIHMELPTSFTACSVRLRWAASCHWCMHQLCAFITSAGAVIAARVRFYTHRSRFVTMRSISFCTDMQLNHCEKSISTLALMLITLPEARCTSLSARQLQVIQFVKDNRIPKQKDYMERPL